MTKGSDMAVEGAACSIYGCGDGAAPAPDEDAARVYERLVADFIAIDAAGAAKMAEGDRAFFLYVGRVTCRWCRRLIPVLAPIFTERGLDLYYLDSTRTAEDEELSLFRKRYGITWVPTVLRFDGKGGVFGLEVDLEADDAELRSAIERELDHGFAPRGMETGA